MAHETFLGSIFKHGFRSKYLQKWLNSSFMKNLSNKWSGSGLTQAEVEANEFSAEEAQKNRDFQQQMSDTSYQRGVADMQQAGLNPALMYGGGASGASTPSGAAATSVSPTSGMSMSELIQLITLPLQMKQLSANVRKTDAEAIDVAENAKDRRRGVDISGETLDISRQRLELDKEAQSYRNRLTDAEISKIDMDKRKIAADIQKVAQDISLSLSQEQLNDSQTRLNKASAYQISAMIPYQQALVSAQTEQAKAQAALLGIQQAYESRLYTDDYVDAIATKLYNDVRRSGTEADLAKFKEQMRTGSWGTHWYDKIPAATLSAIVNLIEVPFGAIGSLAK